MSMISTDASVGTSDLCVVPPAPPSQIDQIERAYKLFFRDGDVVEMRLLEYPGGNENGYYSSSAEFAHDAQAIEKGGVYFCINPCDPKLLNEGNHNRLAKSAPGGATGDQQVVERRHLVIDIDSAHPTGQCATDEEKQHAVELAATVKRFLVGELGWPDPIVVDSGNGVHMYWRILLSNTEESLATIKELLGSLHRGYSTTDASVDTVVCNASRIMRLPGTINRKGKHTAQRPHRLCRFLEVPESPQLLTLEKIQHAIKTLSTSNRTKKTTDEVKDDPDGAGIVIDGQIPEELKPVIKSFNGTVHTIKQYENGKTYALEVCPLCKGKRKAQIFLGTRGGRKFTCKRESCDGCESKQLSWSDFLKKIGFTPPPPPPLQWEPMPLEFFPGFLKDHIIDTARALSVDPAMIGSAVLGALSAAIGNSWRVNVKPGWKASPCLWSLVWAKSGQGKSPVVSKAIEENVLIDTELLRAYDKEYQEYLESIKSKKKEEHAEKIKKPIHRQAAVQDFTIEALKWALACSPRGLLVATDEGNIVLLALGQYKNGKSDTETSFLSSVWSHEWAKTNRKKDDEVVSMTKPYAAMVIAIQPSFFRDAFPQARFNNGFTYRFLMCSPPELQYDPRAPGVSDEMQAKYNQLVRDLYSFDQDYAGEREYVLGLDPEDKELWNVFVDELQMRINNNAQTPDRYKEAIPKIREYALRLALWRCVVRWVIEFGVKAAPPRKVEKEDIEWGIKMARWYNHEIERTYEEHYGLDDADKQDELVAKLINYLKTHPGVPNHKIQQNFKRKISSVTELKKLAAEYPEAFTTADDGRIMLRS